VTALGTIQGDTRDFNSYETASSSPQATPQVAWSMRIARIDSTGKMVSTAKAWYANTQVQQEALTPTPLNWIQQQN
jgi:hypothetical protein